MLTALEVSAAAVFCARERVVFRASRGRDIMRKSLLAMMLLAVLAAGGISCRQAPLAPAEQKAVVARIDDPELTQEYLRSLWLKSDHQEYVRITGTIDVAAGGTIAGVPEGWPASCVFTVTVPPNALPPGHGPRVTLTIAAPRMGGDHPSVFLLEPDGLQFVRPVKVRLWHAPWLPPANCLRKYCLTRREPIDTYSVSDYELFRAPAGQFVPSVNFQTKHFSRWPVENGKGP